MKPANHSTCAAHLVATLIASALLISVSGCDSKPSWKEPGPRVTFETFLMNVFRGEDEEAFASIAPEDREVLTAPLDQLEGVPKEAVPEPHEMWVITSVENPYDVKQVEVAEKLEEEPAVGRRVRLDISYHDGRTGTATMVWGGERWFVDLPLEADESAPATNAEDKGT